MYYPATLTPYEDGSGRYSITFEDLPGCVSQGENLEDALRMAQEALTLHIGSMIEDGDVLPPPSSLEEASAKNQKLAGEEGYAVARGTMYQYVLADVRPRVKKAASVNLSISLKPTILQGIDAMAEEMGLSRSGVIAVAARDYIQRMQN